MKVSCLVLFLLISSTAAVAPDTSDHAAASPIVQSDTKLDLIKKTSDIIRSYVDSPRTIAQLILRQNKEVKRAKVEQFVTRSVDEALFKLSLEMKSARIIDGIIHNHMYQRSSSSTHT